MDTTTIIILLLGITVFWSLLNILLTINIIHHVSTSTNRSNSSCRLYDYLILLGSAFTCVIPIILYYFFPHLLFISPYTTLFLAVGVGSFLTHITDFQLKNWFKFRKTHTIPH